MNFGTGNSPTLDKSSAQDAMRRRYLTPISMVLIQHQIQQILALVERCYPRVVISKSVTGIQQYREPRRLSLVSPDNHASWLDGIGT